MGYDSTTSTTAEMTPPEDGGEEDTHLQPPSATKLPFQQQQQKINSPRVPLGNPDQFAKANPPLKKRQWTDPPGKYALA